MSTKLPPKKRVVVPWTAMNAHRRGAVLLLVVGAVGVAILAAMGLMAAGTPLYSRVSHTAAATQARMTAESAVDHARMQLIANQEWSSRLEDGAWEGQISIDGQPVDMRVEFMSETDAGIEVQNHSFEEGTGALSNPLFNPPMQGVVGGWTLKRRALAGTGLTVPRVGVRNSARATDGSREAYVTFVAALVGSGTVSRTLQQELESEATYAVSVDIGASSLPILEDSAWFELYAGETLLASSREAGVLLDLSDLGEVLEDATSLLNIAEYPAVLIRTLVDTNKYTCELRFQTDSSVPSEPLRLEMHAQSLGILSEVTFDNVRVARTDTPVTIRAQSKMDKASHVVVANVRRLWTGETQIIGWEEE